MLQFLEPIWLYAIAAIAAPIIIHLWNNRHGKKLKIGSIVFLEENAVQRTKRNFISEWFLLLLRCLLIILLAFLLAQPFFKKNENVNEQKGWLMINKNDAPEIYSHFKTTIDSLLQKGYELHAFNKGFEKMAQENLTKKENNTSDSAIAQYRLLYQALDKNAPSSIPIYVFSSNDLVRYKTAIPTTKRNIKWLTYTKSDSESKWINDAYITSSDSVSLTKAISKPSGTIFIQEQTEKTPVKKTDYEVTAVDGNVGVGMNNKKVLAVDTSTFKITIYNHQFANDAEYLKSAIGSIQKFSKRKIRLSITEIVQNIPANQDWVFWLSDDKIPSDISSKNIFAYSKGTVLATNSWIDMNARGVSNEKISISKYVATAEQYPSPEIIWKDGFGKPILLTEKTDGKIIYHFNSRFDPSWNELVWNNLFPSLLMNLFFAKERFYEKDKRTIADEQIQPKYEQGKANNEKQSYAANFSLNNFLWFFAFVIFFLERIVSFSNKKGTAHV